MDGEELQFHELGLYFANQSDLCTYFDEINRIARQCDKLNLLLNPTKTQEMMFSTQYFNPCIRASLY